MYRDNYEYETKIYLLVVLEKEKLRDDLYGNSNKKSLIQ